MAQRNVSVGENFADRLRAGRLVGTATVSPDSEGIEMLEDGERVVSAAASGTYVTLYFPPVD